VHKYPFDEQQLEIRLENPIYPADQVRYVVDTASSYSPPSGTGTSASLNPALLSYSGWKTEKIEHLVKTNDYRTDWGLPNEPDLQQYAQSVLRITLVRHSWQHLAEILLPLMASAILTTLVFFLSTDDISSAIQICVIMFIGVVEQHHGFLTT